MQTQDLIVAMSSKVDQKCFLMCSMESLHQFSTHHAASETLTIKVAVMKWKVAKYLVLPPGAEL